MPLTSKPNGDKPNRQKVCDDAGMFHADSGEQQQQQQQRQRQRGHYVPVVHSNADGRLRQLDNDSLSVHQATADDAGFYLCHASNGVGADLSKVVRLIVHSKQLQFLMNEVDYNSLGVHATDASSRAIRLEM